MCFFKINITNTVYKKKIAKLYKSFFINKKMTPMPSLVHIRLEGPFFRLGFILNQKLNKQLKYCK